MKTGRPSLDGKKGGSKAIVVKVPKDIHDWLLTLSKDFKITKSEIVREALEKYYESEAG